MIFNINNPTKIIALVCGLFLISAQISSEETFSPYVDNSGNIFLPEDFRLNMTHLGSWFVADGGASGFHDVYTEKHSVKAFRKTGTFPDGTILVKELRSHTSGAYTTGENVNYANQNLKQWFVMIKDEQNRFQNHPLWGDGWGWALYKPDNPKTNIATDYKKDCLACHIPAKEKDFVYTEAYPSLTR